MGRPAVFLDRDGVVNRAVLREGRPYPPADASSLELLPGVRAACTALKDAGFLLLVVTNQPDVARGTQGLETVEAIHGTLRSLLPLDDIYVCPHDDADACDCRKPAPGLLVRAAAAWDVDLATSYMVGDRWRDVEAGQRAGCRTVFVDRGYAERRPDAADHTAEGLEEAAQWILQTACM